VANADLIRGRQVVVPLTNKSGGSVALGDVVVIGDGTNDNCFTTTTTASFNARHIGIAQETIANAAVGRVLTNGYAAIVNTNASVARDTFLFTHTVAKEATGSATRAAGAFGQVLETGADPEALIWGMPDPSGAAAGALQSDDVQRTAADVTTSSTTFVDVTSLSITLTTGARRCLIGFVGHGYVNNATGTMCLDIDIDGTRVSGATDGAMLVSQHATASETMNLSFTWLTATALSAASHTFKVQFKVLSGSHTGTINASSTSPAYFWVAEIY
jgi:hypothetical protein